MIEALLSELFDRLEALRAALAYAQTRLEKVQGTADYLSDELPIQRPEEAVDDGHTHAPPSELPLDAA